MSCPVGQRRAELGCAFSCRLVLVPFHLVTCGALRCYAVQCGAMRCYAVQCSAAQCSAMQRGAARCSAVHCGALRCIAVQCGALHCMLQCRAILGLAMLRCAIMCLSVPCGAMPGQGGLGHAGLGRAMPFRAVLCCTSRSAPTASARSTLLITSRSDCVTPGPPLRGTLSPPATSIT